MAASVNRQILLKSRPEGAPSLGNFELTETPTPEPGEGEVLMRIIYLSLDPYMRGRMSAAKSYATPAAIGHPMVGGTVGEIVKSRNPKYSVGDIVLGYGGWQDAFEWRGVAQARSDGGACLDGARRPRHAGDDRLYRSSRNRSAEAWGDCRRRGSHRRRRLGRRANRHDQRLPRGRDRRRRSEVPLRCRRGRFRCLP